MFCYMLHYSKNDNDKYIVNTATLGMFYQSKYIGKGISVINNAILLVK